MKITIKDTYVNHQTEVPIIIAVLCTHNQVTQAWVFLLCIQNIDAGEGEALMGHKVKVTSRP